MTILSHFKKGIAALAVSAMAFTMIPSLAFASLDFTDVNEIPTWAVEAIEELVALDVLGGNADGSFAPARQLNRAEVAKIITLASGVDFDTTGGAHFPDVEEDAWYYDYVETMYNYGWIDGNPDGTFRPGNGINRAELAKMVINALELDLDTTGAPHFDDVTSGDWFFEYVETAYNYDLMRGYADGTFGASKPVNRAETAKIVYDGLLAVSIPDGPAEGTLEVMLSEETPRGTNVPYNATSVPYTTIELTASDDADVEISSLTFTRLGLGDNDDFKNVWMEIDGFKVGNDKSINNDDVVELRFNPPLVTPAGQTLVADVVASAKYTSSDKNIGHHNRLALVSADDVASTAMNVVGDFPIEGEEMEVADYQVSEVDFSDLGSDTTIDVGDNFIEIGKFRMLNESSTNKDVEIRAITFKNDGTAELENVLENVALYVSGEQVSAESIIDGDYITFRLDNGVTGGYIIEDGDSRIFSMRADIVSAEKGDTINFKIDNFEDLVAIEIGTAFGVKATSDSFLTTTTTGTTTTGGTCSNSDAEDNCARLKMYTIDSGDINVSRDPSSLGNQQYAPGSNDIVAMTARVIVDQPLLVDGVTLTSVYTGTANVGVLVANSATANHLIGANAAFNNYRLFLNDNLIDSENAMVANTTDVLGTAKLEYDTTFEIAGASILKLVLNIQDAAPTGSTIKFNLASSSFSSPEYISTGDQVPTDQLLGSAQGSLVEVTASALTITKTDGFSSETIVAGLDDVTFMEFVLDNNDSGDVNVTSITVDADDSVGSIGNAANYTAAIFVDGAQQGSSKNFNTTTEVATFNDLSVVVPSAGQKEFAVVVNTNETSSGDVLRMRITAVDADNVENGQTVYLPGGNATTPMTAVNGSTFTLVASGSLVMSIGSTIYSDILVAGADEVEVLKIRFNAADDEVQIKDLYLDNNSGSWTTFGPRADFKLYNEAGQLVQTKQMQTGDLLHFELANQDRISVPKDDSTFVTLKVDVRDITQASMTGKRLKLTTDTSEGTANGVEALTAATGTDLAAGQISGTYAGEPFVAYRTEVSVKHAATQPNFSDPSSASQEIYRFTISADAARQAEIGRVTFDVALSGMKTSADAGFVVRQVKTDGTIDNTATVTSSIVDTFTAANDIAGTVTVNFSNQRLASGESRTFALFMDNTVDTGTAADDDAVNVTISNDSAYVAPAAKAALTQTSTYTIVGTTTAASTAGTLTINGTAVSLIGVGAGANTAVADAIKALIDAASITGVTTTSAGGVVTVLGANTVVETVAFAATGLTSATLANVATQTTKTVWSDESSNAHTDSTLDWLNGYLLDTDTTSMTNAD